MLRSPLTSEERASVRDCLNTAITIIDGRSLDGRPLGDFEDRLIQYRTLIEVGKEPKPLRMSRPRFVTVPRAQVRP